MEPFRMSGGRLALLVAATALIGAAGGYWAARQAPASAPATAAATDPARKVLYWYDPMVPDQHFDKPGKSPFMDMQLVPRYADGGGDAAIRIDPVQLQNTGVRLATVEKGTLAPTVEAIGTVAADGRIDVAVPESQSTPMQTGLPAALNLPSQPGAPVTGRVVALSAIDPASHALPIRIETDAPGLKAGQSVHIRLTLPTEDALLIPTEALIRTGRRDIVMVARDGNRFAPVEVRAGREADGRTAILAGLSAGQRVVASGNFLIDSEASLAGLVAQQADHQATGVIDALDGNRITLSHSAVPSLNWGPMTMPFILADNALAQGLKVGDLVRFSFRQGDQGYVVESLAKTGESTPGAGQ